MRSMKLSHRAQSIIRVCRTILIVEAIFFVGYQYWALYEQNQSLEKKSAGLEVSLNATEQTLAYLHQQNVGLLSGLTAAQVQNQQLGQQVTGLSGAVGELTGTVGTIQKLSKLDPELLKKYSRVYFLSENYIPSKLTQIDSSYLFDPTKDEYIQAQVWPFLQRMINAASHDGVTLEIASAYRSFDEQKDVKTGYQVSYGSGANQFSADQGYSEHQLGTACDLTTPNVEALSLKFETSPAYKWLAAN